MFNLDKRSSKFGWELTSISDDRKDYQLKLLPSADTIIGKYKISIQIRSATAIKTSQMKELFCLVFNPWVPEDDVYMEGQIYSDHNICNL